MITVIVDEAEQRPWTFSTDRFRTERQKLRTGDYTLLGLESRLCVERKSLGDFIQTVIHDWIRFRKQLVRMSGFDTAIIVVECHVGDIWDKKYESPVEPESLLGRMHSIFFDHGIPTVCWGPKPMVDRTVAHFFEIMADKYGVKDVGNRAG